MIPNAVVTAWGRTHPWGSRQQIEQDLLLARLIVDIYNHPYLGGELVFRGGTCLHQLRLPTPLRFSVDTSWFRGSALVQTYVAHELVATKIRALYQRRKGRDLFDLWVALSKLHLDPKHIVAAFAPYRPDEFTGVLAERNLREKLANRDFRHDLDPL